MTYRGYRIEQAGQSSMLKIMHLGSGPVSAELDGYFTTVKFAEKQIDMSLNALKGKKKNVKKESTS